MAVLSPRQFQLKDGRVLTLCSLNKNDAHQAARFDEQVGQESTNTYRYPGQNPRAPEEVAKQWANAEEDPRSLYIGAFDGSRLMGGLFFYPAFRNHPWYVHSGHFGMMIFKEFWGQGLGREMLRLQEEFARSVGYTQIGATVREGNDRGLRLYESAGFQVTGREARSARIDDKYVDSLLIVKFLD